MGSEPLEAVVHAGGEDAVPVEDDPGDVQLGSYVCSPSEHVVGDYAVGPGSVQHLFYRLTERLDGREEVGEVGEGDGREVLGAVAEEVHDGGGEGNEEEVNGVGGGGDGGADEGLVGRGGDYGDGDVVGAAAGEEVGDIEHGDHVAWAHQGEEEDAEGALLGFGFHLSKWS